MACQFGLNAPSTFTASVIDATGRTGMRGLVPPIVVLQDGGQGGIQRCPACPGLNDARDRKPRERPGISLLGWRSYCYAYGGHPDEQGAFTWQKFIPASDRVFRKWSC